MRFATAVLVLSILVITAPGSVQMLSRPAAGEVAQAGPQSAGAAPRIPGAAQKRTAKSKPAPKESRVNYASMPLSERVRIQFDLAWAGYFDGLINGEFNDKSIAAVKAFQKDSKLRETGMLAPPERALLASLSSRKQQQVGWQMFDDRATGAQIGLPTKELPNVAKSRNGTRWSSAQGQIQIETFRLREPGLRLATVYEQQRNEPPGRKIESSLVRDDLFILSGMQGLKKFSVRADLRDLEVRGLTVLYDVATEGIMDPAAVVMRSAFAPFPGMGLTALFGSAPPKVGYGTGIVVDSEGRILTDRQFSHDCNTLEVSGYGNASVVAEDATAGTALLRLYGRPDLTPAALTPAGGGGPSLTLIGIADPQIQAGGRAITIIAATLDGDVLRPPPQLGFAGAAAIDAGGRFFGMVTLKSPLTPSAGVPGPPQASTVVSLERLRPILDAQHVVPTGGRGGAEAAKASVVRVICVRR